MNNSDSNSEQNDTSSELSSLKLALIAAAITTIGDGIATIAALTAIDEAKIAEKKDSKAQKDLDEKLLKMQRQIDRLSREMSKIKHMQLK
ncbi:hypothetical protein [Cytobacillus praedii]|uniref:Translation initiation factor 2 n=1 Tax=Cytobacillus praedii TaxID=1742358 RepID=A0A4V2NT92_9BACI|nr:hypothetical protein [Cytobacillus praedii]TCI99265.1 hypothetical protein E0Y62_27395 [Cytobacillus praedii]